MPQNRNPFEPLLDVDHLRTTYSRERQAYARGEPDWGGDLADDLACLLALEDAASIAAVIVEPMTGSAGVFASPKGYLQRLREITRAHGILLIFDEVITGFGRLGHAFAAERYGVVPDMICFAKGVTNGAAPLGGVLVQGRIHDAFMQGPDYVTELAHGFTYSGHPLGVAAASAALDLYREEGLFERGRALEPVLADAVHALKGAPYLVDIRTIGGGRRHRPRPRRPVARLARRARLRFGVLRGGPRYSSGRRHHRARPGPDLHRIRHCLHCRAGRPRPRPSKLNHAS
jgi:beta-alanine--pyruvate transaminase